MKQRVRQLIILFSFVVVSHAFARGPESGGGGGLVNVNGKLHLVDFYNIENSSELLKQKYSDTAASQIETEQNFSFSQSLLPSDEAFKIVLDIFNRWSDLPYDTIGLWIKTGIYSPLVWNFTDQSVSPPASYRPVLLSTELEVIPIAFYQMQNQLYNVHIDRRLWNQLSIHDQVGLLIHETLRHIQIGRSSGFDDEALQKATAMMMVCKPRIKLDQYLSFLLNNRRDLAEERFEKYELLTKNCDK